MGKSKRKKKNLIELDPPQEDSKEEIIPNLSEKCIHMKVKNGSKMRNILAYALKEFPTNDAILWTAAGEAVTKAISCVEIFKRHHPGLHQVTKLESITSKKSLEEKDKDGNVKTRYVAQINILLTRETTQKADLGFQASDDTRKFLNLKMEHSVMGLPTGQKRSKKEQQTEAPLKKKKKKVINR